MHEWVMNIHHQNLNRPRAIHKHNPHPSKQWRVCDNKIRLSPRMVVDEPTTGVLNVQSGGCQTHSEKGRFKDTRFGLRAIILRIVLVVKTALLAMDPIPSP